LKARDYRAAAAALKEELRLQPKAEQSWLYLIDCLQRTGAANVEETIADAVAAFPQSDRIRTADQVGGPY
jgi:hypothetical protein